MDNYTEKLVLVSLTNSAGGAEQVLNIISNETNSPLIFLKQKFQTCLPINYEDKRVKFLTRKSLLIGFLLLIKELRAYRSGYTIMSTHPYLNAYLGILKRIGYLRSSIVVRECNSIFIQYRGLKKLSYQIAYALGYPAISLVVCQTDVMRDQLLEHNSFLPKDRVIVQDNPINLDLINQKAIEPLDDLDAKTDFICAAGRLVPVKGFNILIKSFESIAKEYPKLKLLILGEGKDRDKLNHLIVQLGLENQVKLKGHVDNPYNYFKKAKICVVSSTHEGFPNVLLQMMAVNKSVVSTLCAGGIETINSITKVGVNNVSALSEALKLELLKNKPFKDQKMNKIFDNRTPEVFVKSIFKEVRKKKSFA